MMILAISLTACGPGPQPVVPAEVPEAEKGDELRKKTGDIFVIALESNPTTGYSWALDGTEDATVVRKVSDAYVGQAHAPGLVGVGGTEQWTFKAEKKGRTALHLIYRRPWEKGLDPVRERRISVEVD